MSEDSATTNSMFGHHHGLSVEDLQKIADELARPNHESMMGMNVIVSPHVPEGMAFLVQREALSLPKPKIMYPPYVDDREDLYRVHWDKYALPIDPLPIFSFSAIADVAEVEPDYRLQAIIGWIIIFVLLILFLWWGWM